MNGLMDILQAVIIRFVELLQAPLTDPRMLWSAIPLFIATIFMTLYFGKYQQEQLGWNTAFGNTMVFLFVSLNIIQYLYYADGTVGSWDNVLNSGFYLTITVGLLGASVILMLITYYHLLPKGIAFFLFSAAPVNVSVYVLMTIVYTGVPADRITLAAAIILFAVIFAFLRSLQTIERMASRPEGLEMPASETAEEKFLKKLKDRNVALEKRRHEELLKKRRQRK